MRTGTFVASWPIAHLGAVGLRHEGERNCKRKRFPDWQAEKVTAAPKGILEPVVSALAVQGLCLPRSLSYQVLFAERGQGEWRMGAVAVHHRPSA